ncbi:MAG: aromatic ring-hydroxylating dioxygenase subunit alpha [Ornithinimicrobium sp.]
MSTQTDPTAAGRVTGKADIPADIAQQIATRVPGYPLPSNFYTSEEIFAIDTSVIFGQYWFFATLEAHIPEAGDFVTVEVGPSSVIVLRDDDEEIAAFHNVCRHRGAKILNEPQGSVGNIVCGYHYWTYGTDGALRHAPGAAADFSPTCFALKKVAVRNVAGLIYLCLADEPPADFDASMADVAAYLEPHNLAGAKVAAQVDIVEDANWKLVMENNRECYHCEGHPELSSTFFLTYGLTEEEVTPKLRPHHDRYLLAQSELEMICDQAGLPHALIEDLEEPATGLRIMREALDLAGESFSLTGKALCARPLADLPSKRLGRCTLHTQPNMWGHTMADHAVLFAAFPISVTKTLVRTMWLVHADAEEGIDYDVEELTHVWRETNAQDSVFTARAQIGVASPAYEPGPYMPSECQVDNFVGWYIRRVAAEIDR